MAVLAAFRTSHLNVTVQAVEVVGGLKAWFIYVVDAIFALFFT
jgi:hypothetical protein